MFQGAGGVPFSQRTQGTHAGWEQLVVCVWEQGGGLGAQGDGWASDVVLGWTGKQRHSRWGRWQGLPAEGVP